VAAARARHPSLPMRRPLSAKPVNSLPNVLSPSPPPAGHPSLAPPVAKPIDGDDEDGEDDDPPSGEEEFDEEVRGWRKKRKRKKTRDSNPLSIFQAATATVGRETQHARATGGGAPFHPHTPRHTQVDDPASGGEEEDDNPSGDEEAGDPAGGAPADDDPEDEEDEEEDFDEEEDDFTEEEDDEEDVSYFVHPERRAGGAVHVCTRPRKAAENGWFWGRPGLRVVFSLLFSTPWARHLFFTLPLPPTQQDYDEDEGGPALGTAALVGAPIEDASADEDFESGEEEEEVRGRAAGERGERKFWERGRERETRASTLLPSRSALSLTLTPLALPISLSLVHRPGPHLGRGGRRRRRRAPPAGSQARARRVCGWRGLRRGAAQPAGQGGGRGGGDGGRGRGGR
jgi:hypothetical protein